MGWAVHPGNVCLQGHLKRAEIEPPPAAPTFATVVAGGPLSTPSATTLGALARPQVTGVVVASRTG